MENKNTKMAVEEPINFRRIEGTILYRSSRPYGDSINAFLKSKHINTIVDLRDLSECSFDQELAHNYTLYLQTVKRGVVRGPRLLNVNKTIKKNDNKVENESTRHHLVIPFINNIKLILKTSAPWYTKVWVAILFLVDIIVGTTRSKTYACRNIISRDGEDSLFTLYKYIFDNSGLQLKTVLKLLSRPERVPAVVCCSLGKDRTGMLSAIIGHICGRNKQELVSDFTVSQENFDKHPDFSVLKDVDNIGLHPVFKRAPSSAMARTLAYVEQRYGSINAYLDSIGFGEDDRDSLKQNVQDKKSI